MKNLGAALLFVLGVACSLVPDGKPARPGTSKDQSVRRVTILATSGIGGRVEADGSFPGLLAIDSTFSEIAASLAKGDGSPAGTLIVDLGGALTGTYLSHVTEGRLPLEILTKIGFVGTVPGRETYSLGLGGMETLASPTRAPLISANVYRKGCKHRLESVEPYVITEAASVRVALIGLDPMVSQDDVCFRPESTVFIELRRELAGRADFFIAVASGELPKEFVESVQKEVPGGVDLVLSRSAQAQVTRVGSVSVVSPGDLSFARVDLAFQSTDRAPLAQATKIQTGLPFKGAKGKAEAAIKKLVSDVRASRSVVVDGGRILGDVEASLPLERERNETALENWLADRLLESTRADMAVLPRELVRAPIQPGALSYEKFFATLPGAAEVSVIETTWGHFKKALASALGPCPSPLAVAGLRIEYFSNCQSKRATILTIASRGGIDATSPDESVVSLATVRGALPVEGRESAQGILRDLIARQLASQAPVIKGRVDHRLRALTEPTP